MKQPNSFQTFKLKLKAIAILKKWSYDLDLSYSEAIEEVDRQLKSAKTK